MCACTHTHTHTHTHTQKSTKKTKKKRNRDIPEYCFVFLRIFSAPTLEEIFQSLEQDGSEWATKQLQVSQFTSEVFLHKIFYF